MLSSHRPAHGTTAALTVAAAVQTGRPVDMPQEGVADFDEFVRSKSSILLRSAYLLTNDQHLAEDLVQSALERTHRYWRRLRDTDNATAYTRKVMYHLQVAWWRRSKVKETFDQDHPRHGAAVTDSSEETLRKLALRHALAKLTNRQRAVIVLRFYEDRSVEETAAVLGCSTGTVKSQTAKAIGALRQQRADLAEFAEWSRA